MNNRNVFPPPTSDREALDTLINHFLGDYYTSLPMNRYQYNTEVICIIMDKYPKKVKIKDRISNLLKGMRCTNE